MTDLVCLAPLSKAIDVVGWDVALVVVLGIRTPLPEYTVVAFPTVIVGAAFRQELSLAAPTVSIPSTPEFPSASVMATRVTV